jgi:hypothetical protein
MTLNLGSTLSKGFTEEPYRQVLLIVAMNGSDFFDRNLERFCLLKIRVAKF